MADESIDVDNFEAADQDSVSGAAGYIDDHIQIDDDDDDDDDDDTPILPSKPPAPIASSSSAPAPPAKLSLAAKAKSKLAPLRPPPGLAHASRPLAALPARLAPLAPKKRQRPGTLPGGPQAGNFRPIEDEPQPGDYKLRAAGVSADLREFLVAKFRDGVPRWHTSGGSGSGSTAGESDTGEPVHARLFRDGERTKQRRIDGLATDKKARSYRESYRGQRREARQQKQGYTSFRERLLRDWKMELSPTSVNDRLEVDRQARIDKRLKRGDLSNTDLDVDVDLDDDDHNDKDKSKTGDDANVEANGDNKPSEPTISDFKKLVRTYTGQFDGRTADSKFAFMVVDESTKMIDVVPVGDCSMFVFRAEQSGNVMTSEEVEALAKQVRQRREKDERRRRFADTIQEQQMVRDHKMGDRSVVNSMPDMYNPGITRGAAPPVGENEDIPEDFDFEKEFDNDDLLQVDKEEATKPQKEVLVDAETRNKDFRRLIKDEPAGLRDSSDSEEGEQEKDSEETKDAKDVKDEKDTKEGQKDKDKDKDKDKEKDTKPVKVEANPTIMRMSMSPSLSMSPTGSSQASSHVSKKKHPTPVSGANSVSRRAASPSSATTRRGTPQMQDVAHLLPPSGTLPTEQHVRAVLAEMLKDRSDMLFKEFCRMFERKTNEQKRNLIRILQNMRVIRKNSAGELIVTSARPQS